MGQTWACIFWAGQPNDDLGFVSSLYGKVVHSGQSFIGCFALLYCMIYRTTGRKGPFFKLLIDLNK